MDYHENYAAIYDIVTGHKNYKVEAESLVKLFESLGVAPPDTILSVGCGTGSHEFILAERGFDLFCIDKSNEMIEHAIKKNNVTRYSNLQFSNACFPDMAICANYCASISLFNVINCLPNLDSLSQFFSDVYNRLQPNGIFFFEFWNSRACLIEPPVSVTRYFNSIDSGVNLKRVANPTLSTSSRELTIQYLICGNIGSGHVNFTSEHYLKLFTYDEILSTLKSAGFLRFDLYEALPDIKKIEFLDSTDARMLSGVAFK